MTLVLSFDCAVIGLGVALLRGGDVLAVHRDQDREQAARLLPVIAGIFDTAQADRRDMSMIAVTIGPGSFTGVRVGLAVARGLALALDVPLAGISTTTTLLNQLPKSSRLAVAAVDSRLGDWFCALGEKDKTPFLATTSKLVERLRGRPCVVIGPPAARLAAELVASGIDAKAEVVLPDPVVLGRLAGERGVESWRARNRDEGLPRPLYLRGVNVTLPDGQRRTVD
jgi:tRNA threonylcarbamoyladenosine biosynthesis protein TsaB